MPVIHDAPARQFTLATEHGDAVLAYEPLGDAVLDLQHTVVPPDARGGGVGDALVRGALEIVRAEGLRIVPTCAFVAAWLRRHPEARDLVAEG